MTELDIGPASWTSPALCDRWTGVGADGLIRVARGEAAAYRFMLTNADGSAAAMSGNGMRCLGAFVCDAGHAERGDADRGRDGAGVRTVTSGEMADAVVGMGEPNFTKAAIPMRGPAWETFQRQPFDVRGVTFTATALSMGNPHLVLFLDEDPERFHVEHMGPMLESHELFPERTNVEFARDRRGRDRRRAGVGARRGRDARLRHRGVRGGGRGERGRARAAEDDGPVPRRPARGGASRRRRGRCWAVR